MLQSLNLGAADDTSSENQTPCNIYQENMYRVECVEQIFEVSDPAASLMIVEIKKQKAGEGVIFCTEKADLDKACHNV